MWWQLFIVLVATAVASGDDVEEDYCMSLVHLECEQDDKIYEGVPSNEEELEEFCKITLKYLECADRVFSSCEGGEDSYNGRYLADVAGNLKRICNEDAALRSAVAENLLCFWENYSETYVCEAASNIDKDSFYAVLNEAGVTDMAEDDSQPRTCANVLFGMSCSTALTGKLCGDAARDVLINIFQGMDTPFEVCPPEVKEKLPEITKGMQMEIEKAKSVEDILKKKK